MNQSGVPMEFELAADVGPQGGPSYRYRHAFIHTDHTGKRYELILDGFPASPQRGLGSLDTIRWVIDAWIDR